MRASPSPTDPANLLILLPWPPSTSKSSLPKNSPTATTWIASSSRPSKARWVCCPMHIPLMTQIHARRTRRHQRRTRRTISRSAKASSRSRRRRVNVLTDMAIEWEQIDEGAAEAAVKRAQEAMASKDDLGRRGSRRRPGRALQDRSPSFTSSAAGVRKEPDTRTGLAWPQILTSSSARPLRRPCATRFDEVREFIGEQRLLAVALGQFG